MGYEHVEPHSDFIHRPWAALCSKHMTDLTVSPAQTSSFEEQTYNRHSLQGKKVQFTPLREIPSRAPSSNTMLLLSNYKDFFWSVL